MSILKQRSLAGSPSMSLTTVRSKEWDGPSRWTEYLSQVSIPPVASRGSKTVAFEQNPQKSGASHKSLNLQWVVQLSQVGEGLLAKMYRLNQILDYPDSPAHAFSEAFWKSGVIPNYPKICVLVSKKFPEHPSKLQLERVDKVAWDALHDNGELYFQSLEQWIQLLLDLMAFREQALRLILDLSSTVITLLPHQNSLILHAFMDLFCSFVRVNLYSERIPRKMILQMYNILHAILYNDRDCDSYHRLVQFVDSYDPPLRGLHEDLNFVSPRIGEVLEAVGPVIFLSTDTRKLRNEGFLSPFHPRYPDILTNSAHPMRAQDLANVTFYREWALFGYLVCPDELLRVASIDIASVVLKENLVLPLFRNEYVLLHEDYQLYVLPRILESKKMAKSGRAKQKDADLEYSVAKQVEKMLSEVHDHALSCCDSIHRERRVFLKQEIERMVLFFTDQPSLLAPNIQMVFSALAFAQYEVLWYFQHIGIAASKSKAVRVVPVDTDPGDPTIGFLLDGTDHLCCLVRKYTAAIRGYALSYLSSAAARIRFLLGAPGMVALDVDVSLKKLFQKVVQHLENLPKLQGESMSAVTCDLSELRKDWLSILMLVTSARSSINIRHLEKATVSTGKEGMVAEGNAAYQWSRCIDELEAQLSKYGSFKNLYFYHQHLTTVFRNTMFGPEGRPQHCCAWLGVASSFPQCSSPIVPEEITKIGHDAVLYVESLIESIMGGLEGLINILDSDGGFGSLEIELLPEQAALNMNYASRVSISTTKISKGPASLPFPGHESYPENNSSIKMLEAAMQRLTNLCSVLNDMEPICVLQHVFVLREYMRECILGNFRKRLHAVLKTNDSLQCPSTMESLINRHISIVHLAEHHISMDLTQGIQEVLIQETFSGPVSSLHSFDKSSDHQAGHAIDVACNWYTENIVKDVSGVGILFAPIHKSFNTSKPIIGAYSVDPREFKSFVRVFGGYGVDKLDRMMKEHTAALLNCIETSLRSNREVLESITTSFFHSGGKIERASCLEQILDLETLLGFCIEAGLAMAFDELLAEAAGGVLEEGAPLIYSLLTGVVTQLPNELPEAKEIKKMRAVCNSFGVTVDHDSVWVKSIFEDVGGVNDASWSLLPHLFAAFMTSSIWSTTLFIADNGGFNNNIHCLARCVSAVIAASVMVRTEREKGLPNEPEEIRSRSPPDAAIKSAMKTFVKFATLIIFDSLNEANRSHLAVKLIFLDQLCTISPYLPRTTLEAHIPYALLRSVYAHYHSSVPTPSVPLASVSTTSSPHRSPAAAHTPPIPRQPSRSNSAAAHPTPNDSVYAVRAAGAEGMEKKQRNVRMSGPLDYSSSRKAKMGGGEGQSSRGPSPLRRFMVSRSGPLSSHRNG